MPSPTIQNAYHGPLVTLSFAGNGSVPGFLQSTPISPGSNEITSFLANFLLSNRSGSEIGNLYDFQGLNPFSLRLSQAQMATLYRMSLTPIQATVLYENVDTGKGFQPRTTITLQTIFDTRCSLLTETVPPITFSWQGQDYYSNTQTISLCWNDPSDPGTFPCTPKIQSLDIRACLRQQTLQSDDVLAIICTFEFVPPSMTGDEAVRDWLISYRPFLEQVLLLETKQEVDFDRIKIQLETMLTDSTLGALVSVVTKQGNSQTFRPSIIPFLVSGSYPKPPSEMSLQGTIFNQDIVQVRRNNDVSGEGSFLCYTDRGRDNTPWMSSQGIKTTDPNTYWRIYALNDDGTVSCDRTKKIQTNKPVAFQSLVCTSPDKCFSCSFISSQGPKKGGEGEAPSMEEKTTAGVCERWYLKFLDPPGGNQDVQDIKYGRPLYITTAGAQPRRGCKNAGKALKQSCVVNNQDVCLKDLNLNDDGGAFYQWVILTVDRPNYLPFDTCPCPPTS